MFCPFVTEGGYIKWRIRGDSELKTLSERLKPLPLKGKLEYIIEYYSFHMIAAVVIIAFLAMGVYTFTNQPKEVLALRVVGTNVTEEQSNGLQKELERLLVDPKHSQNETLSVMAINTSNVSSNPESLARIQKLAAEISAKEVDVLLIDEESFQKFNQEGNLYDLSRFNEVKEWTGKKYSLHHESAKITGIDVSRVSYLSPIAESTKPLILAVAANSQRMDDVKRFIHSLK